jgi:exonuclease III
MATPKGLAARAVVELTDGRKIYIEVRDNSKFVQFYTVYTIRGRGRAREYQASLSINRNYANSIEAAAEKMAKHFNTFGTAKVKHTKVKIYRKKLYKQRFKMRPDELGLTRVRPLFNRPKAVNLFTRKTEAALA